MLRSRLGKMRRLAIAGSRQITGRSRREREALDESHAAILMYHRVLPEGEAARLHVEPGMWVSPATFELHASTLSTRFNVVPLHELIQRLRSGESLPPRACAITFDDGWLDNLQFALPVLERFGLPATIFVVTDRVGTSGAFWTDEVVRRFASISKNERRELLERCGVSDGMLQSLLGYLKSLDDLSREQEVGRIRSIGIDPCMGERELLDWDELDQLASKGFDVESHGTSHTILTRCAPDTTRQELSSSLMALRNRGHGRHALIAYPSGGFDADTARWAEEAGYLGGVTTERGVASRRHHPLTLPRIALHEDISSTTIEFLRWVPGSGDEG